MSPHAGLEEGWYLMATDDLERELHRWRNPEREVGPSNAEKLSIKEALAYRNAGNLADERGRTLRLVLYVSNAADLQALDAKRLLYEPDAHDYPAWRRPGSKPVNVVPLRDPSVVGEPRGWWAAPEVAELEAEWQRAGTVAGIDVPGPYRGFVYKTVVALRRAGIEVTPSSIADSVSRWLPEADAVELRAALGEAIDRPPRG